uniref:Uncharacterized protein n=1 Tax=Rhizophora mucronata TaxID=61149 RepID=A0A2P2P324_RHIMU
MGNYWADNDNGISPTIVESLSLLLFVIFQQNSFNISILRCLGKASKQETIMICMQIKS